MFGDLPPSLDWTAVAIAVLTLVLSGIGWAGKRFSGKLDRHMDKVETFMGDAREHKAVVNLRVDSLERRQNETDKRLSSVHQIDSIHGMVSEMHERCGVQQEMGR